VHKYALLCVVIGASAGGCRQGPIEQATHVPQELTVDLGSGVKMELILVRTGWFMMGSNEGSSIMSPVHKVTIRKPFYLGKYEVTQEQWKEVMGNNPSLFVGPTDPVGMVSWQDCQVFLRKLREIVPTMRFRLPAEAEWEYACRAGSTTEYYFGGDPGRLGEYAWCFSNSGDRTHPVGEKKPNAWGFHDMYGNVWEWCQDVSHDGYWGAPTDGRAWEGGGVVHQTLNAMVCGQFCVRRVQRDNCWGADASICHSAYRSGDAESYRVAPFGLRVAADVPRGALPAPVQARD